MDERTHRFAGAAVHSRGRFWYLEEASASEFPPLGRRLEYGCVTMRRHLAAILAADIAGYSRLMGEEEEDTVKSLQAHQASIFPLVRDHNGRIINIAGDGFLAEFDSVVAAVRCAVAVQKLVADRNVDVPTEKRLEYRVGINQGEIIVDGDDVYGDGINVAARLQTLAKPGGIAISGRVQEDVAGKLNLDWRDAGEQTLKNIARPVRVWQWPATSAQDFPPAMALPDRPSIAVLPFDNIGGAAEETFFSDGITEDIITGLARCRSLFVVARNSSFAFRGKDVALSQIAAQLGVAFILEGSVRRAGGRIRITAQLIEAASGLHLWAERYDRDLNDIFDVQDEVVAMIVATLVGRIEEANYQRSIRKPPVSLAAYDLLLRGIVHFRGYADNANAEACACFEEAIALDERYALAHAYLGLARLALHGYIAAPAEVKKSCCSEARRAVELDPQDGRCHRILGHLLLYDSDYELAEHHARRALELNPSDADCVISMGFLLAVRGRPEEGVHWIEKAMRLNPFHPPWYHVQLGVALYSLRRFSDAAQAFRRTPHIGGWSYRLAACYGQLGRAREAAAEVEAVLRAHPEFSADQFLRCYTLLERPEDRELLREGMIKAGLPE